MIFHTLPAALLPALYTLSPAAVNTAAAIGHNDLLRALLMILCILFMFVVLSIVVTIIQPFRFKGTTVAAICMYAATGIVLVVSVCGFLIYRSSIPEKTPQISVTEPSSTVNENPVESSTTNTTEPTTEAPTTEATEPTDPRSFFTPAASEDSNPENFGIQWEIFVDGEKVESYQRENPIYFPLDEEYFSLPGVSTFRGNPHRDDPTYGTTSVSQAKLSSLWNDNIGTLGGYGGCCWTGQPLVVEWDEETKAIMNLYESKKAKENLVEVIYATLDGYIHFYDLEDGSKTRDSINMGVNFKGAGSLDPRGYPLLYVGSGYNTHGKDARMYIISLIDGSILYEAGNQDPQALRTDWSAFDSSPLIHAGTDTLIWPGENGILYTCTLNTAYDKAAGTITVAPDNIVKTRYSSNYSRSGRYLGYESSASVVMNYLYISENSGLCYCVDLNTMELIWVQDTLDDSNSSPVFEWGENGEGYIYTAPSLHWTAYASAGTVSIYKLDAATGDVLWTYSKDCTRNEHISGGVQSTPILGRDGSAIEDMVIYTISSTPSFYKGVITALNKETGEVIWEVSTGNYAWSSPLPIYAEDGKVYLIFANASGYVHLLDAQTGESLSSIKVTGTIEASPVLYGNYIVIGTREKVYGLKIS